LRQKRLVCLRLKPRSAFATKTGALNHSTTLPVRLEDLLHFILKK